MGQVAVYAGVERRRRWSEDERLRILTEAFSPGGCVAQVARQHDISTGLIYTWRRKFREAAAAPDTAEPVRPDFSEAVIVDDSGVAASAYHPALVVELAKGQRISIFASASPALVAAALKALR